MEPRRFKMEPWRVCTPMIPKLICYFDEEQDPEADPYQSKQSEPEPYLSENSYPDLQHCLYERTVRVHTRRYRY
jgi:hypothetical protein